MAAEAIGQFIKVCLCYGIPIYFVIQVARIADALTIMATPI